MLNRIKEILKFIDADLRKPGGIIARDSATGVPNEHLWKSGYQFLRRVVLPPAIILLLIIFIHWLR